MRTTVRLEEGTERNFLRMNDNEEIASLCSFAVEGKYFGMDTRTIREVLGSMTLQRVPLAPAYIGGIVPYRGDVLTTVSLRALLKLPPLGGATCVLVLEEQAGEERFGLAVDSVGGVMTLNRSAWSPNPATLDERSRLLFKGSYRTSNGALVQLAADRIRPLRLEETGFFAHPEPVQRVEEVSRCGR